MFLKMPAVRNQQNSKDIYIYVHIEQNVMLGKRNICLIWVNFTEKKVFCNFFQTFRYF